MAQISLLIDNLFASFLPVGSISWLYYSDRLSLFPVGGDRSGFGDSGDAKFISPISSGSTLSFVMILDWAIALFAC